MKLIDYKVIDFINEVDSPSAAPGGGSVSALVSALGASLCRMVGHLTIGKKKYMAFDDSIKAKFEDAFTKMQVLEHELVRLIDEDTDNFNLVMAAFKMSKDSDDDKAKRSKAIEEATIKATKTPFRMVELSCEVLRLLSIFVEYGNKNALSDVGVAALLALAGAKGAIYNVRINIPSISDEGLVKDFKEKCDSYYSEVVKISNEIEKSVLNSLG